MKVRLNLTPKGIEEFEGWLDMWRVPKGKWVKQQENIYEGRLNEMKYSDRYLELLGFKMRRLSNSSLSVPMGNTIFCPDGLVTYAGIRVKEGWREVFSSCLHPSATKTEVNRKTLSHSAAQVKYQHVCSCGADWIEWQLE